ncbi:MAG: phospholipase D family protein [bacterium]|nr:phospholipase D family protein [bacterium]
MYSLFVLIGILIGYNTEIGVCFSPHGGCKNSVIDEIKNAKTEILIAMYYFTDNDITNAVCESKKRGVNIRVVLDKSQKTGKYNKSIRLVENDIPVRYDTRDGLMHDKFAVIDDTVLVTGSFNWTKSADEKNRENIMIIKNPEVAKIFRNEFEEIWGASIDAEKGQRIVNIKTDKNNKTLILISILVCLSAIGGITAFASKRRRKNIKEGG